MLCLRCRLEVLPILKFVAACAEFQCYQGNSTYMFAKPETLEFNRLDNWMPDNFKRVNTGTIHSWDPLDIDTNTA